MLSRFFDLVRDGVPVERAEVESKAYKGGGSQTVSSEPPAWSVPHLQAIGNMAGQLSTQPQQYYPGSTVIPFAPQTQGAMAGMEQFAGTDPGYARAGMNTMGNFATGNYSADPSNAYYEQTARGDFLNSNPYLDEALNAATDPVKQQINSQFSMGGRYGSGSHAGSMAKQLGGIRTQAYADNYARERQNQMAAYGGLSDNFDARTGTMMDASKFLPVGQGMLDQSFLSRLNALSGVGGAVEGKAGEYLTDATNRFDFAQNEPWNRVSRYASLINPGAGLGGTQTTTLPGGSKISGALGGGLSGAMLGSMIPGIGGGAAGATGLAALGPAGIGLGALGLLSGFL